MAPQRPAVINELHSFLEKQLKSAKVLDSEVFYLTSPGDNYGSETLKITATVKWTAGEKAGTEEILHLVSKQPPNNDLLYNVFQPQLTCVKENNIYLTIAPALEEFQREKNVPKEDFLDIFAKGYGSRLSLDESSDQVDRNALLVMENLYYKGYQLGERMIGFDEEATYLILTNLAKFHALTIGYRYLKPSDFEKKFRPNLTQIIISIEEEGVWEKKMLDGILDVLKPTENIISEETLKKISHAFCTPTMPWNIKVPRQPTDTPWKALSHNDLWVNNIMLRYDKGTKKPIDIKILDFQMYSYQTTVLDVIFFLFTSTDYTFLKYKFFDCLKFYHDQFIRTLKQLGMSAHEHSYDSFLAEVRDFARYETNHILFMLRPIMTRKEKLPDTMDEMDTDSLDNAELVGEEYFNKVIQFVEMFQKFGLFGPLEYYEHYAEQMKN